MRLSAGKLPCQCELTFRSLPFKMHAHLATSPGTPAPSMLIETCRRQKEKRMRQAVETLQEMDPEELKRLFRQVRQHR